MFSVTLRTEGLMRLTPDKNLSGEENYIFNKKSNTLLDVV